MQKLVLESAIQRYYLDSLVESTKWVIKNNNLNISFIPNEDKSLVGNLNCGNININDCELGIFNTSQLLKLIKILDDEIEIKVHIEQKTPIKLLISDTKYNLEYYLADINMIGKTAKVKEPEKYEIQLSIDKELISKFSNAKKALGESKRFTIEAKEDKITFVIGEGSVYSNSVKFDYATKIDSTFLPIPFSSELFNTLLSVNKNSTNGTLNFSKDGLIKVFFKDGDIDVVYFLVRLEE